jgi:pilus assembly protein TadC
MRWFEAKGLTGESYYRTRRADVSGTLTVLFGVAFALYAGAAEVLRLVNGVRRFDPAYGLSDYMVEVIKAAIVGAVLGALVAELSGRIWERRHRARRKAQPAH